MRRTYLGLAALSCLLIAGCAGDQAISAATHPPAASTPPTVVQAPTDPVLLTDKVRLTATRTLVDAELGYATVGQSLKAAVTSGLLKPGSATAIKLADLYATAGRGLEVARSTNDYATKVAEAAKAGGILNALKALIPGSN